MKTTRRHGREAAMQCLFQTDFNPGMSLDDVRAYLREELAFEPMEAFALELYLGVREHLVQIDTTLGRAAVNWSLDRMPGVDRNILRVAAYELLYREDVPPKVAINEALEIAKRFAGAESVRFINGVLDRVARRLPTRIIQLPVTDRPLSEGGIVLPDEESPPESPDKPAK